MSSDRPFPHLQDLLRGRDGEGIGRLALAIIEAALDESHATADVQTAAIAAAAMIMVETTRAERRKHRCRDAELLFHRFMQAYEAATQPREKARAREQLDSQMHIADAFTRAWPAVVDGTPVPARFAEQGVGAEQYREILAANDLQHLLRDAFAAVQLDHATDWIVLTMAAVQAAAMVCGGAFDTAQDDEAGFVDDLASLFRTTALNTIAHWRKQKAN